VLLVSLNVFVTELTDVVLFSIAAFGHLTFHKLV